MSTLREKFLNKSYSKTYFITAELVNRFAEISGDFNALHTDAAFGRKSNFRQNIAHGMLSVAALCDLELFKSSEYAFSIKKVKGKFLKPVFLGEEIILSAKVIDINDKLEILVLEFSVIKNENTVVISGSIELMIVDKSKIVDIKKSPDEFLLSERLIENINIFENFMEEDHGELKFKFGKNHLNQILNLFLKVNTLSSTGEFPINYFYSIKNILPVILLSTFVGMRIPGRYATFLDFELNFNDNIKELEEISLIGKILLKSEVAKAVVLGIEVQSVDGDVLANGRVTSRVNNPPAIMPSLDELIKEKMKFDFSGKIVLISGSSRGLGEVIAKMFALYGAKVVIHYFKSEENAKEIVSELLISGCDAIALKADVRDQKQVQQLVRSVIAKYGTIDILVNNAVGDYLSKGFFETTWEDILNELEVTLKGAFNFCQEVIPVMQKKKAGKVINISTLAAEIPPPNQTKYILAKSALNGLTKSLAVEFAQSNIQINSVVPGLMETDLTNYIPREIINELKVQIPMKRHATPVDVAKTVLMLASDFNSYTTGQKIYVTGGQPPFN